MQIPGKLRCRKKKQGSDVHYLDKLVSKITTSKKTTIRFGAKGNGTRTHILSTSEKSNVAMRVEKC